MNLRGFNILLLLLILLLGVGNYIQWRSANQEHDNRISDNRKAQVQHIRDLIELGLRDSVISTLLTARSKDSITHAKSQVAFKTRLNALRKRVTGPAVVQDTIIIVQDSLIRDLENERDTLFLTDNQAIDSLQASVKQLKGMYQAQYLRANISETRYDRERRKRWSLGPHVGYGFKGPDFGVSIQYSLFKF